MEKKHLLTAVLLTLAIANLSPLVRGSSPAHLYVDPPLVEDLGVGDSFTVGILVESVANLTQLYFNLTYAPDILSCKGVIIEALAYSPSPIWEVNDSVGFVMINVTYGMPITTGSPETLVSLLFYVEGKGQSGIVFEDSILGDPEGVPIPHGTTDGFFKNLNPYDLNQDGIVDLFDVEIVALAFGSYPGHPNWDPRADVNNDNLVDIFDLILVTIHLGET
jgi:hypothetical protein